MPKPTCPPQIFHCFCLVLGLFLYIYCHFYPRAHATNNLSPHSLFIYSFLHLFICSFVLESLVKQHIPFPHEPLHAHINFYSSLERIIKSFLALILLTTICFPNSTCCCLIFLLAVDPRNRPG